MHDLDQWNGQYRRPKPHFSDEKPVIRPTIDRRALLTGCTMLGVMSLLLTLALLPRVPAGESSEPVRADTQAVTRADCQIIQHLTFTSCGHEMTRRQQIPGELAGKTREEITAAYDPWQVTTFSAGEIAMEQTVGIFCPEHVVLMPDAGGMLCIFQNRYGDALALVKELHVPVGELPDAVQDAVRRGKGFSTIEELEQWLEGAES